MGALITKEDFRFSPDLKKSIRMSIIIGAMAAREKEKLERIKYTFSQFSFIDKNGDSRYRSHKMKEKGRTRIRNTIAFFDIRKDS